MTLWLDAHFSARIADWITKRFGIAAQSLREIGLRDAEDSEIWSAARNARVVFVTKDADFEERVRRLGPPPHPYDRPYLLASHLARVGRYRSGLAPGILAPQPH